jgi:hypothetical protein
LRLASSDDAGMMSSIRLAGAAALCAALLLSACAKKTDQSTTTSTDTTTATSAPASGSAATPAPEVSPSTTPDVSASAGAAATSAPTSTTTTTSASSSSNGTSSGKYITLPIYPGATVSTEGTMSMTTNTGSFDVKVYSTKDDAKKVAEWYKAHLPASFKNGILTSGDKTVGTFVDEHTDGDQSVIVANQPDGATRIQLSTKHGK